MAETMKELGIDRLGHESASASSVSFVAHPPERRHRRPIAPALAGGCCCCCCCCLHTLGSIIGAAVAPTMGDRSGPRSYSPTSYFWEEEDERGAPALSAKDRAAITSGRPTSRPLPSLNEDFHDSDFVLNRHSAASLFWWSTLVVLMGGMFLCLIIYHEETRTDTFFSIVLVGGIIALLVFPGVQLAAAIVTFLILTFSSREDKGYQLRQLGKIVLGVAAGAVLGILAMVGIGFAMSLR